MSLWEWLKKLFGASSSESNKIDEDKLEESLKDGEIDLKSLGAEVTTTESGSTIIDLSNCTNIKVEDGVIYIN